MIKKNCVVCGKEIEVVNSRYCLCSDECRKARAREYQRSYMDIETHRKYMKEKRWRNPKIIPCKICGEPVPPTFNGKNKMCRSHYHENCVLSEAIKAIQEGCKCNDKRIHRAWNTYGYTMSEIIEGMKEKENVNEV